MKKIFLLFLLSTSSFWINAQTIRSIGLKIGRSNATQIENYRSGNAQPNEYREGFYTALGLEMFSKKYLSFTADIAYCQKGFRNDVPLIFSSNLQGDGTYLHYGARQDYISFNPSLKIRKENTHFVPYALVGLRMDYQIGYKADQHNYWKSEEFKKAVFGFNVGFGVDFKFNKFAVGLEYHFQNDITPIFDYNSNNGNSGVIIKNIAMVMAISCKYYLNN